MCPNKLTKLSFTVGIDIKLSVEHKFTWALCGGDIKASLTAHPEFENADQEKDVLTLLQGVNFSFQSSQEPTWPCGMSRPISSSFVNRSTRPFKNTTRGSLLCTMWTKLGNNIHDDLEFIDMITLEHSKDPNMLTCELCVDHNLVISSQPTIPWCCIQTE